MNKKLLLYILLLLFSTVFNYDNAECYEINNNIDKYCFHDKEKTGHLLLCIWNPYEENAKCVDNAGYVIGIDSSHISIWDGTGIDRKDGHVCTSADYEEFRVKVEKSYLPFISKLKK